MSSIEAEINRDSDSVFVETLSNLNLNYLFVCHDPNVSVLSTRLSQIDITSNFAENMIKLFDAMEDPGINGDLPLSKIIGHLKKYESFSNLELIDEFSDFGRKPYIKSVIKDNAEKDIGTLKFDGIFGVISKQIHKESIYPDELHEHITYPDSCHNAIEQFEEVIKHIGSDNYRIDQLKPFHSIDVKYKDSNSKTLYRQYKTVLTDKKIVNVFFNEFDTKNSQQISIGASRIVFLGDTKTIHQMVMLETWCDIEINKLLRLVQTQIKETDVSLNTVNANYSKVLMNSIVSLKSTVNLWKQAKEKYSQVLILQKKLTDYKKISDVLNETIQNNYSMRVDHSTFSLKEIDDNNTLKEVQSPSLQLYPAFQQIKISKNQFVLGNEAPLLFESSTFKLIDSVEQLRTNIKEVESKFASLMCFIQSDSALYAVIIALVVVMITLFSTWMSSFYQFINSLLQWFNWF